MRQRFSARIRGRIASANDLYAFQMDPGTVRCAVEAAVFNDLPQEGDHALGSVVVLVRKIDLITEEDQPLVELHRRQHVTTRSPSVRSVGGAE